MVIIEQTWKVKGHPNGMAFLLLAWFELSRALIRNASS
jgi:hypothetical protein